MDKNINLDAFEAPNSYERVIKISDAERTYHIAELSDADVTRVFRTTDAKGNADRGLVESLQARAIAACVRRPDGSAVTFDEARAMRRPLVDALAKEVLAIHGFGIDENKVVEDNAKN